MRVVSTTHCFRVHHVLTTTQAETLSSPHSDLPDTMDLPSSFHGVTKYVGRKCVILDSFILIRNGLPGRGFAAPLVADFPIHLEDKKTLSPAGTLPALCTTPFVPRAVCPIMLWAEKTMEKTVTVVLGCGVSGASTDRHGGCSEGPQSLARQDRARHAGRGGPKDQAFCQGLRGQGGTGKGKG